MNGRFGFPKRNYPRRRALAVVVVVVIMVGLAYLLKGLLGASDSSTKHKQVVHQIQLLKPPPPPPPKPPEKPPEVKKEEVKIEQKPVEQPKAETNQAEAKQLGIDAEGTGAGDSFGLIGNKGGRDLVSNGGSKYGWYAGIIQAHLQETLAKNKALRTADFRVVVNLWVRPDGSVQRAEVVGTSGKPDVDEQIRLALAEVPAIREAPPSDMPQPVRLRLTNRI
jgi:protein TonB